MAKKRDDTPWAVKGGRPSAEAIVRACLVLLGRSPVAMPAEVGERTRRDEAARALESTRAAAGGPPGVTAGTVERRHGSA